MKLTPTAEHVLDLAKQRAKRAFQSTVVRAHLRAALAEIDVKRYELLFGPGGAAAADAEVAAIPASDGYEVTVDPGVLEVLEVVDGPPSLWTDLAPALADGAPDPTASPIVAPPPAATPSGPLPAPTPAPTAAPALPAADPAALHLRVAAVAAVVPADPAVVGRTGVVADVLAVLGQRHPPVVAVVGMAGSGRTSTCGALAAGLDGLAAGAALAGWTVLRVGAEAAIAEGGRRAVEGVLAKAPARTVVVFDDLDVLLGLDTRMPDDGVATTLRSCTRTDLRLLVTLPSGAPARLATVAEGFAGELHLVNLPALGADDLATVAERVVGDLAAFHAVTVEPAAVAAALRPPPPGSDRAHPGLLVERLDAACARASLRPADARVVTEGDISGGAAPPPVLLERTALEEGLGRAVLAQDHAIGRIAARLALTRARLDLRPERPDGVFLLVGPTGVGKTALARALARELFGSEDALIRLDMSEYAHDWALSRLVGPQPGYVGYTEPEGWLTTKVREKPSAVVLLDEVEKAHPTIWNAFLQVFDTGSLTDGRGQTASFSDAVVVLTSNLGADAARRTAPGFGAAGSSSSDVDSRVLEAVRAALPPELLGRVDETLVFHALDAAALHAVVRREVDAALVRLAAGGFDVTVDDAAVEVLATDGADARYGARHVQRNIERLLLTPLLESGLRVAHATAAGGAITWT